MSCKKVLCLGDSNTYGYDPRSYLGGRYPSGVRWTGLLTASGRWDIANLGQNGRCILRTDAEFAALMDSLHHFRPDGMCILLGSNDILNGADADTAAVRMVDLIAFLHKTAPSLPLLLIAPPVFQPGEWVQQDSLIRQSVRYAANCRTIAARLGLAFADAGEWDIPVAFDGVHFTPEGHTRFAQHAGKAFEQAFGT